MNDTPYLALTGELWGVFREIIWPWYIKLTVLGYHMGTAQITVAHLGDEVPVGYSTGSQSLSRYQ